MVLEIEEILGISINKGVEDINILKGEFYQGNVEIIIFEQGNERFYKTSHFILYLNTLLSSMISVIIYLKAVYQVLAIKAVLISKNLANTMKITICIIFKQIT